MADRRRRRRRASQDSEEDDDSCSGSDSPRSGSPSTKTREGPPRQPREPTPSEVTAARPEPKKEQAESECESEDGGVGEAVLSDYDSADPEENGSHSEGVEEEEEAEHFSDEESKTTAAAAAAASGETKASKAPSTETTDDTEANAVATDASEAVDGQTEALVEAEELVQEAGETGDEGGEEEGEGEGGEGEGDEREEEEDEAAEGEEEEQRRKDENKTDEKENIAGERQSGDGQESTDDPETKAAVTPGQKLDDDEDRKNPAYIPRKGLFFEHDVRGQTQEEERPKGRNRKLWKDEGRWEHDRFREEEQAPKSRDELVAIYGYDIRNGGGQGDRGYRQQRRPRQSTSPVRDKRWRDGGGERERPVRSWQNRERERAAPPLPAPVSPHSHSELDKRGTNPPPRPAPNRNSNNSRPSNPNYNQTYTHSQYRTNSNNESNAAPPMHHRERPKAQSDPMGERGGPRRSGGGQGVVIEDISISHGGNRDQEHNVGSMNVSSHNASPRRYQQEQRERNTDRSEPAPVAVSSHREASPPTERPTERKSYSAARRTRSRPSDLGSKQPSVDETVAVASVANVSASQTSSQGSVGGKVWATGDGPGNNSSLNDLDQDVARLSLAGQNWSQSPTSYIRSEMRGLPAPMHLPSAPQPFSGMDEMGVGSNRAKRYSSQRQRPVPEPAPPIHMGVMEGHGHYYEPMSYPGPIYGHGEGPAPIPPQGMMVQPEMHIPHPGLHPHQSGGPIANPALYGGPPVSLSPGQPPQQLLPPPFYPPPGVMTFPYPTMYPTPQAQAQVTYGGVTYYDTMQQQAQPKPSPPRRTSQPVSVKPPPELHFASE